MIHVLRVVFTLGPLIFGIGFLAPLIDQALRALGWPAPFGLTTLLFGLLVGGLLGVLATVRGRWV